MCVCVCMFLSAHPEWHSNLVKQGELEQREGPRGRWRSCHVELTNFELRLYSLDSSGNRQLCTAFSLSHCQAVNPLQGQDGHILEALFFNSTRLQLRAPSQWEAQKWSQLLWECVLATRPPREDHLAHSNRTVYEASAASAKHQAHQAPSRPMNRPTTLPLFTENYATGAIKVGQLKQLCDLNNWRAFNYVLTPTHLLAFPNEDKSFVSDPVHRYHLASCVAVQHDKAEKGSCAACFQAVFASEVLRLQAANEPKAQSWMEALRSAVAAERTKDSWGKDSRPRLPNLVKDQEWLRGNIRESSNRKSITTSFLSILTCLAGEKGLTAQNFRCAGIRSSS